MFRFTLKQLTSKMPTARTHQPLILALVPQADLVPQSVLAAASLQPVLAAPEQELALLGTLAAGALPFEVKFAGMFAVGTALPETGKALFTT